MAQSSIGFNGTVNDVQWAALAPLLGQGPCVEAAGHLAVSGVGGFRRVLVAAGSAFQSGVRTTLSVGESPAADMGAPAAGQWHLLVLRRVWASKATSLVTIPHSTTTNVLPVALPASYPAAMLVTPGVQDDQPLAWCWVNVTTTVVEIVPLHRLPTRPDDGSFPTTAARDAYYGTPATFLQQLALQGRRAVVNRGALIEKYFGLADAANNPGGASPAGWYPVGGRMPKAVIKLGATAPPSPGHNAITVITAYTVTDGGFALGVTVTAGTLVIITPGYYRVRGAVQFSVNGTGIRLTQITKNAATDTGHLSYGPVLAGTTQANSTTPTESPSVLLAAGDVLRLMAFQNSGAALALNGTGATATANAFEVEYLGPPVLY